MYIVDCLSVLQCSWGDGVTRWIRSLTNYKHHQSFSYLCYVFYTILLIRSVTSTLSDSQLHYTHHLLTNIEYTLISSYTANFVYDHNVID